MTEDMLSALTVLKNSLPKPGMLQLACGPTMFLGLEFTYSLHCVSSWGYAIKSYV